MTGSREHLHHLDYPLTLRILGDFLDYRSQPPVGYERTEYGAWVDWVALATSYLSSTEVAVVHVARGCAVGERHGGLPNCAATSVRCAIEQLTVGG